MKKIKSLIVILLILMIVIFVILVISNKNANNENEESEEYPDGVIVKNEIDELQDLSDTVVFFTIENIINNCLIDSEITFENLLDTEYISNNKLTINKFKTIMEKYQLKSFDAKQIKQISDKYIYMNYVYGKISEQEMDEINVGENFFAAVKLDYDSMAYSVIIDENVNSLEELIRKISY